MQSKQGLRPGNHGSNNPNQRRNPPLPNTDSYQPGGSYYQTPNIMMHANSAAQALSSHPYPGSRPRPLPPHLQDRTPSPTPLPPRPSSSAERRAGIPSKAGRLEPVMEGDSRFLREVNDPPPGDQPQRRTMSSSPAASKQRSHYFEQAFRSPREASARQDEIRGQSMIFVEIKTNVIVKDEVAFMADLSGLLAKRYNRAVTSIAISLQPGVCMQVAGSFASAYAMSIHALPSQVQTATNKRNTALIQQHLEQALRVLPARGLVRFVAVPEECLGSNGKTVASELAELISGDDGAQVQKGVKDSYEIQARDVVGPTPPPFPLAPPLSQDTSEDMTSLSQDPSISAESQSSGAEDAGPTPPPKDLKPKKSLKFIQALFRKRSKQDAQAE